MARTILLAVDGSSMSRSAARYAIDRFALPSAECELHLLHAQYRIPPRAASAVGRATVQAYYRSEAEEALRGVRRLLDAKSVPYHAVRVVGSPAEQIARYAQDKKADLIVMGSHGLGAAKGLLLGSVAQGVIAGCNVPVLVVRDGGAKERGGEVLVAADGSAYTRRAITYLLRRRELLLRISKITLMHVTAAPSGFPFHADTSEAHNTEYEHAMRAARRLLTQAHVEWQEVRAAGDPAAEIAAYARRQNSALIVMGSHGRGAVTGLLLGSVAQKILNACQVPVLIVR